MRQLVVWALSLALPLAANAGEARPELSPDEIRAKVEQMLSGYAVDDVRKAPMAGFYEVTLGTRLLYISTDGKYMLLGDVIDADGRTNLTDARRSELVADRIEHVAADTMIVIGPKDPKHHVTVFTDVDCPYCAKFHRDVPALNEAGVQVRYLLFPRAPEGTRSYQRAVAVWCSDDPIKTIGIAKAGGDVAMRDCPNPVAQSVALGHEIGVTGTPAIVLDDGRLLPGYVPAPRLLMELGMDASQ